MAEDNSLLESIRALLVSNTGKEQIFYLKYSIEEWNYDDDINIIFEKSDEKLSDFVDNSISLSFLSTEARDGLRKLVLRCGRLVAFVDGSLGLYLSKDKESVDIVVMAGSLSGWGKTMENMRYVMEEASEISIDISPNGRNIVLSVTYDLIKQR